MDPRSGDSGDEGVGSSSTKPNMSISLASMLEKSRLHTASREGDKEGDSGSRLPPPQDLAGVSHPQEHHLARHTPGRAEESNNSWGAPGEGIVHLPGLKKN